MKLLLLLFCLAAAEAGVSRRCEGPVINGTHYSDVVLKSGLNSPLYLSYDSTTNSLYYTHYGSSRDAYKLNLDTKVAEHIVYGVYGVFSVTVDSKTSDVYIGANDGIFKHNNVEDKTELYGAKDTNIRQVYSKDRILYFTTFMTEFDNYESYIYKLVDGQVSKLEDLKNTTVHSFIVDNEDYIIYSHKNENYENGFFSQKLGAEEAVAFANSKFIRGLSIDNQGNVYAAASDGIYFVNKQKHMLDQILAVNECYGVAFDSKNNIIYADEKSIHRLQPRDPSEYQKCLN